jgi:hypothetical protein
MKNDRVVIYVVDGLVTWVGGDSKKPMDYVVVSNDPRDLDKDVLTLLEGPFDDVACLASVYGDTVDHNAEKVDEVFTVREERFGGCNHHIISHGA